METRQQGAGRHRLCGLRKKIEGAPVDPAQDTPARAVMFDRQRTLTREQQTGRQHAARGEMRRDPVEIVINTRPEYRMQALQREARAVAGRKLERKIDQAVGDARQAHHFEGILLEYNGGGGTPGVIACECHLVMIPLPSLRRSPLLALRRAKLAVGQHTAINRRV